jgi:predicted GNAT superfamily acetyltransferase
MIRAFIKTRVGLADKLMVTMDQASGYGAQLSDDRFWQKEQFSCLTSRSFKE